ncbi:MAG: hypothetical protein IJS70_01360 [Bacteroidales bacterium]|nr:hypothetical protein [Bacteroidales bacterium]MBQ7457798.1 hypothetical protein [Bacteroidales bacterium]
MKRITILLLAFLFPFVCFSQQYIREVKVKNDIYLHNRTGLPFPKEVGEFKRDAVYAFDRKKENIGSSYTDGSTKVSVFVYPAYDGYEDRLRREFFKTLEEILAYKDTEGQQFDVKCVSQKSGQYLIHGLLAEFDYKGEESLVSLYECGHWWMKFRITDNSTPRARLDSMETLFRDSLSPDLLIRNKPLDDKFDVYFQKTAFRDSLMLGCVMGQAFAKINWMKENLDSHELQAGVPSLYLDYHLAGIDGALDFVQKHPELHPSPATKSMLDFIIAAKNDGYLKELLYENKNGAISMPDSLYLDLDGYHDWLKEHPYNGDLLQDHVIISNK